MAYFESNKEKDEIDIKEWSGNFGTAQGNTVNYLTNTNPIAVIGARAYSNANKRWENIPIAAASPSGLAHVESFSNCIRLFIDSANGVNHYGGQSVKVYYIQ